ncbi:RDD family protein [Streptosporangiaceae bacterium NEAU-GS5]|nr:RDD family protein [Streptosporangiaceae bacterium NEAU-GS5]
MSEPPDDHGWAGPGAGSHPPPPQPYGPPPQPYGPPATGGAGYPPGHAPGLQPGVQWPPGRPAYGRPMTDPTLAGPGERLLARLIDNLVVGVLTSPAYVLIVIWLSDDFSELMRQVADNRSPDPQTIFTLELSTLKWALLIGPFTAVVNFFYDWIQHARWGRTIGKRAMKIKVVDLSTREPITSRMAARRSAVYALIPAVPFVGGLFSLADSLWLFQDPVARQCLHDKAATTVVVKSQAG